MIKRFNSDGSLYRNVQYKPDQLISYQNLETILEVLEDTARSGMPIPQPDGVRKICSLYGDEVTYLGQKGGQRADFYRITETDDGRPRLLKIDRRIGGRESAKNAESFRAANKLGAIGYTFGADWIEGITLEEAKRLQTTFETNALPQYRNLFELDFYVLLYNGTFTADKYLRGTDNTVLKNNAIEIGKFLGEIYSIEQDVEPGQIKAQLEFLLDLCQAYINGPEFSDLRRSELEIEVADFRTKVGELKITDRNGNPLKKAAFTPLDLRLIHIAGLQEEGLEISHDFLGIYDEGVNTIKQRTLWPGCIKKYNLPYDATPFQGIVESSVGKLHQNIVVSLEDIDRSAANILTQDLEDFGATNQMGDYVRKIAPNKTLSKFGFVIGKLYNKILQEREAKSRVTERESDTNRTLAEVRALSPLS